MITLYSKDFKTKYGAISSLCEAFVEEERNGLFELSFVMLNTDSLFNYVKEDNIVVVNANDTLLNQKFRIYMTRKLMNNRVEVFARHISFDLMYDYIDSISFENQSCEYALNQLFRSSNFSKHYKGYSDIVNAQNYSMSMANILEAIGGKEGSIIDTFGTGAEILRDNENIHVLNKRGHDNGVTIEYRKNLTGFELEEDTTDLITRILPYAKYNNSETNEEIIVKADYVDSPLIANYSHPYIKSIDYSDKFENGEIPTISKLQELAKKEYKDNKVDIPKQNFKIEFVPLSKCVGHNGLEDKISLCDTVTIIDTRYNIKTQSKVIKTVFNVLKNRYESIELGEPRTSLGDIVGNGNNEATVGPPGPPGPPGADGSIGDFPNSLPATPVVTTKVYGFANIEVSWTFENKVYYQYEVYASKEANFTPNTFNLIHQGQTSTFMYQAKPNETWYFKVCCINTHGERTSFGSAFATTKKIDDLSNYVENMAIGEALIGELSLDRGWIGKLNANLLDVKGNFSVTDGNGKRTLDIDSFGNVYLDVTEFKVKSEGVVTSNDLSEAIEEANKFTKAEIKTVNDSISLKVNANGIISAINLSPENIKIMAKFLELNGATSFVSNNTNTYAKIVDACYSIWTESVRSMYMGGWKDSNNKFTPVFYMGKNGFNSESSDVDGTYFSMTHDGKKQYLGARNKFTGGWSTIEFDAENQVINFVPENKCYTNKPFHFANGVHCVNPTDNAITSALTHNGLYANRITAYSGDTIYLAKNVAFENGNHAFTCNNIYIDTLLCNSDAKFWGYAYSSFKPIKESSGTAYLGTANDRWNRAYKKQADDISSDERLKENIEYIQNSDNVRPINNNITISDMYNFVKDDLNLAKYNYINENDTTVGFIAQDIEKTKVGSEFIHSNDEGYLSYDSGAYINILAGALKKAIEKIEALEKEIEILKAE